MDRSILLENLKKFKKLNENKYDIESIGIFGSYARNENSDTSDVDIVVTTKNPDLFNIVHIKEDLEKQLGVAVDIARLRSRMNPYLKHRIEKEAVYV
jgi:hypothetical protein